MHQSDSFSQRAKEELCNNLPRQNCCRRALLYGLLLFRSPALTQPSVTAVTERLCHEFRHKMEDGISDIGQIFSCENCQRAFLRGIFLACGTVSDPASSYHLEISFPADAETERLQTILQEEGLPARRSVRRGNTVLYYKGTEKVSDFLVAVGAQNAAFSLMNETIRKDLRNRANRERNCDAANINKAVFAANQQMQAILQLQNSGKWLSLPDELKETANLRVAHPEATLASLAALHDPPITKSGVNHRLRKLESIAKEG